MAPEKQNILSKGTTRISDPSITTGPVPRSATPFPLNGRTLFLVAAALLLLLVPLAGEQFYTRLTTRIMIYGLTALSLDLILGFGGMVSFGHAAFLGVGAYVTGILAFHEIQSAIFVWPCAVLVSAITALFIGAVSLRTKGSYFIMITLAFAQMLYFFFASLEDYGGDDGMPLYARSCFGSLLNLDNHTVFYYVVLFILFSALFFCSRLVRSRFGMVIQGIRENERRMLSMGFPTFRYKLACFVIAGAFAGLSGVLLANQSKYISPALMHWTRSGDILVMVILGGLGSLFGPVMGAFALLFAEEIISGYTQHWMIIIGPLLILMVLFFKGGIHGIFKGKEAP